MRRRPQEALGPMEAGDFTRHLTECA
jgi:hypothetical protein